MTGPRTLRRVVFQVDDTPTRVATAVGLGIFIAFFPLFGIHTLMALGLSVLFRLNRVALLAGTFTNNPWTVAPMYTAGTLLGCAVLHVSPATLADVQWGLSGRAFYESLLAGLGPLLLPFIVGNLLLGALAGLVAFFITRAVLVRRGKVDRSSA